MILITNHHFPKDHIIAIVDSLYEASINKYEAVTFVKKINLVINYNEIVLEKLGFNF